MKNKNLLFLIAILITINLNAQVPVANFTVATPLCSNAPIQITDLSSNSPTSWSYTLTGGAPTTSTLQNPSVTYATPGTKSITLIATNINGASAPITKTITVNTGASFFINPAIKSMCVGNGPLSFTATSGGPILTYSWNTGATTPSVIVNPSVTTVYTCVATATNGCMASRTATAIVNPLPTVTITSNPSALCSGATATLTATSSGPAPNTFTWSNLQTTASISTSVTGSYSVVTRNSLGCFGSATFSLGGATSIAVTITVAPSTTICAGSPIILTASGASSYTWSTGAFGTNTFDIPTVSTTYTVLGVSGTCSGTTSILVNTVPTPTLTTSPSSTICSGSTTTLSVSGAISYTWNPGALTNTNIAVSPIVNTIYTVTGSNGGSCTRTSTVSISVNNNPSISNAGPSQSICSTTTTLNGNTPSIGTGMWTLLSGGGIITSPNSGNSTITSIAVGTNILQWTISNGVCPASSSTVAIQRDSPPTIANAGPSQTICVSNTTLFGNLPVIGIGMWTLMSGLATIVSPTSPSSMLTGVGLGVNVLQWTISNGVCPPSSAITNVNVSTCTGIETYNSTNKFIVVFPNPAQNNITVTNSLNENNFLIEIYNSIGQLLLKKSVLVKNENIDISSLPNGIYSIRIISENNSDYFTKLIKQ